MKRVSQDRLDLLAQEALRKGLGGRSNGQHWPRIPKGPIPHFTRNARRNLVTMLNAAYGSVAETKEENIGLWVMVQEKVTKTLQTAYGRCGLMAPPMDEDDLWDRIDLPHAAGEPLQHVRLVRALMTDYQDRFEEHLLYRMATDGNVHLEVTGPTGMGKSSCAVGLADWMSPMHPQWLVEHLSIDVTDLPSKLRKKKPGQTVVQDEYVQLAGEGSGTVKSMFQNLEDTLRASQVNLIVLSPRDQDHGTMQARLELILWNPVKQYSVFLVWRDDVPKGVVSLPWMRPELYEVYKPWKKANVERTMQGQFRDNTYLARLAVGLCNDERFVNFLRESTNKPKLKDFETAVEFFHPQMMSGGQTEKLVLFLYKVCYAWERVEKHFASWFGVEPTDGLRRLALKCYEE